MTWTMTFNSQGGVSYESQEGDNTPDSEKHRMAMVVMGKAQELTALKSRLTVMQEALEEIVAIEDATGPAVGGTAFLMAGFARAALAKAKERSVGDE